MREKWFDEKKIIAIGDDHIVSCLVMFYIEYINVFMAQYFEIDSAEKPFPKASMSFFALQTLSP